MKVHELAIIGLLLLVAVACGGLARRWRVPQVTLLLLVGLAIGPSALDLLPANSASWSPAVVAVALTMVGFLVGGEFRLSALRSQGRRTVLLSLGLSLGTVLVTFPALLLSGMPWTAALLLAGIAPATDPVATTAVLDESGDRSEFAKTVRRIVGLDDVWGILVFAACAALAYGGNGRSGVEEIVSALEELALAVGLGAGIGLIAGPLTGRIEPGRPTLLEALGLVFVCAGLADLVGTSTILASVSMGAALANVTSHHDRAFREIDGIEWPFLALFFVLAGASFRFDQVRGLGLAVFAFVAARAAGRFVGIRLGGLLGAGRDPSMTWRLPTSLMAQGGVALGLALSVRERGADGFEDVVPIVVAATVIFELAGPPLTRFAAGRRADSRA